MMIILLWAIQIGFMLKRQKAIRPCFAGFQFLGIAFLVADTFFTINGMTILSWMNVVSAIGALLVLILVLRK